MSTCKIIYHQNCFAYLLCSSQKVHNHCLSVRWYGNILYTVVRKLFSRDLCGCIIHLCIIKLCLWKLSSIVFCISQHYAVVRRWSRITFCLSDGLATYYIPSESSFQGICKGLWFTYVLTNILKWCTIQWQSTDLLYDGDSTKVVWKSTYCIYF